MTLSTAFAFTAAVFFVAAFLLAIVDDEIATFFAGLSFLVAIVTALAAIWTEFAA